MHLPISNRLLACAGYIAPGETVADVGCDHGYLGIHLLTKGIAKGIIAADINEGPLQSAQRNARKYGVADKMSFHLSAGVVHVPRDFDAMVCAGMGADTMVSILEDAPWLKNDRYRLILQCQSNPKESRCIRPSTGHGAEHFYSYCIRVLHAHVSCDRAHTNPSFYQDHSMQICKIWHGYIQQSIA